MCEENAWIITKNDSNIEIKELGSW